MSRWLVKAEPSTYSFQRLQQEKRATWDGVTNPTALIHLRAMRHGDDVIVYHTGDEKACVGLARVAKDPYADPKLKDPKLVVVDLEPVRPLAKPVPLAAIRADAAFRDFDLVRISRLSVMPVSEAHWRRIQTLAGK